MSDFFDRKPLRLELFDYSTETMYFLTLCSNERKKLFSEIEVTEITNVTEKIVGDELLRVPEVTGFSDVRINLTHYGFIVKQSIEYINNHKPEITVDKYVIMPNHIHLLVMVRKGLGTRGSSSPTVNLVNHRMSEIIPKFISSLKRFTNKQSGEQLWQRGYYDHVIRNQIDYEKHWQYIEDNPIKWKLDKYYC